jgi:hypothetical protein
LLRHIADIIAERREPEWLIHRVLERKVLAVLAGARGTFKSFVALDWSMRVAREGGGVVMLSGEGAGLDRRADAWLRAFADKNVDPRALPFMALERPINLNRDGELERIVAEISTAPSGKPELVVIDTLSKFSAGLDENDNAQVAAFLGRLAEALRDTLNCTVLLLCHSGHAAANRPRGASALMANPDAEYMVERPQDSMTITVSRERFKDYAAQPALAYTARVIDLGRADRYSESVTSLVLDATTALPTAPSTRSGKGRGANQESAVAAFKEWKRAHPDHLHISTLDMNALLKAQGIASRQRRYDAVSYLMTLRVLTAATGGYSIDKGVPL